MTTGSSWFMKTGKERSENTVVADAEIQMKYTGIRVFYILCSTKQEGGCESGKLWKIHGVKILSLFTDSP